MDPQTERKEILFHGVFAEAPVARQLAIEYKCNNAIQKYICLVMSAEVFDLSPEEQQEINNLLEVEPATNNNNGSDIPALREQLAVLVTTGKVKEAISVSLTHKQVKRLSDKDVEK